jgi:hypothetical protein
VDKHLHRRDPVFNVAVALSGGTLMFASAFMYWVSKGPGSGLRGHKLVDAVVALGHNVPALSAARLTVLWYLIPAVGAATWIVTGVVGIRSRVGHVVATIAAVTGIVGYAAFVRLAGSSHLGWGPKIALLGGLLVGLASWISPPRFADARVRIGHNERAGL